MALLATNSTTQEPLAVIVAAARANFGPRGADLNARRIAEVIGRLVNRGQIAPGSKLPTVRALAGALRVSPSTVSEAWRILRVHAVITTDRRRGTVVRSSRGDVQGRYWNVPASPGTHTFDLSSGTPDPALLPDLSRAVEQIQLDPSVTSYLDTPVLPRLEASLRGSWPYDPERLTIVDGAQDALDRIISAHITLGDAVVVEDPTFPPIVDMLELQGARLIGVRCDASGIVPSDLERALAEDPVALFVQPRAQNPTGAAMTAERRDELTKLLADSDMIIVEDDHSGSISGTDLHSFGERVPDRVVHIRSYSKSHGPDLRLAALGGPAPLLDPVIQRRHLGPSWTSRLLQQVLLELLADTQGQEHVAEAAVAYTRRRRSFIEHLVLRGVPDEAFLDPGTGMNVWLQVSDEQSTVAELASQGIGVAPGRPFMVTTSDQDYIRVTTATLGDPAEIERVATAVAKAR